MRTAICVLASAALAAGAAQVTVTETMTVMVMPTSASNPTNNGPAAMPLGSQGITDGGGPSGNNGGNGNGGGGGNEIAGSSGSLGGSGVTDPNGGNGGGNNNNNNGGGSNNNEPSSSSSSSSSAAGGAAASTITAQISMAGSNNNGGGTITADISSGMMSSAASSATGNANAQAGLTEQVEGPSMPAPAETSRGSRGSNRQGVTDANNNNNFLADAPVATPPAFGMTISSGNAAITSGLVMSDVPAPAASKATAAALSMNVEGTSKPTEPMSDSSPSAIMPNAMGSSASSSFVKVELFATAAACAIVGAALLL